LLNNSNDEEDITRLCLITNEGVENWDTSDNDDDDNEHKSDYEEEDQETEYDILDKIETISHQFIV